MVNEVNMDFRIPGLPHSVVKHAQSTSVRELIQKIENHPDRHALQQDLRQNQAYNSFSPESKKMIHDVGNIELCELLRRNPKRSAQHAYHIGTLVVNLGTITTTSRRRTTRAYLLLQTQTMGTEFIFYMVELARFLMVFLQFRKSRRRRAKS